MKKDPDVVAALKACYAPQMLKSAAFRINNAVAMHDLVRSYEQLLRWANGPPFEESEWVKQDACEAAQDESGAP